MDQALAANMAKRAALRTKQSNIGSCSACASSTPSFLLSGLSGLATSNVAKLAQSAVKAQKGLGQVTSSIWDYIQPYLAWILLAGLIMGIVGFKFGKFFG